MGIGTPPALFSDSVPAISGTITETSGVMYLNKHMCPREATGIVVKIYASTEST
jgi:hypothetical protein